MAKAKTTYEGLQKNVRTFKTPKIEVWQNQYSDKDYFVKIETDEFTCVCPKTGLPDFATIIIEYVPDKWCIELKSFKLYLTYFRNVGIFHEHVTNRILNDFVEACKPRYMHLETVYHVRGGIKTTTKIEYRKKGYKLNADR